MPTNTISSLLSYMKWNTDIDILMDRLTDENHRDELFRKVHVRNPFYQVNGAEQSSTNGINLGCGHTSSDADLRLYLTQKLCDGKNVELICCPDPKCGIIIDYGIVMQLLCNDESKQNYQRLMINNFVEVKINFWKSSQRSE